MIAIFSKGILRTPHLASLMGQPYRRQTRFSSAVGLAGVAGWGMKATSGVARAYGEKHGLPYLSLEDGFLRSVGLGVSGYASCSMIVDNIGIYYDASRPSRLETLIAGNDMSAVLLASARKAIDLVRKERLSKYNHAPSDVSLNFPSGRRVLVIDQTAGDVSVSAGQADAATFSNMLESAIRENPDATIIVKTHPDVLAGIKKGYLFNLQDDSRIICVSQDCNPITLIEQVDRVYVVTSQMGFEALMLDKPVVCFGLPWYACWGLTDDRNPAVSMLADRRSKARTVEHLFAAAYIQYTRYINLDTGEPATIFDAIQHLAEGKRRNDESRGTIYCVGMSVWKKAVVAPFLSTPSCKPVFVSSTRKIPLLGEDLAARILVWGRKDEDDMRNYVRPKGVRVVRMEDGFLRSVGLGSNLKRPMSLVFDRDGIYYDPRTSSSLERWLKNATLSEDEQQRAIRLRERLVALKLSKYNVGTTFVPAAASAGRRVLLVPGQVEGDASLRYGSPEVNTNAQLLQRVRDDNPDAYIIYKPHPDVVAGNREGAINLGDMAALCDEMVVDGNIIACILAVDEVHTMTSQAGFEALMYGKVVHCYGRPFYSGWSLTIDHAARSDRGRVLCLDTLVYGALIHYPRYIDPVTLKQVSVERIVDALEQARRATPTGAQKTPRYVHRQWHKAVEILRTFR